MHTRKGIFAGIDRKVANRLASLLPSPLDMHQYITVLHAGSWISIFNQIVYIDRGPAKYICQGAMHTLGTAVPLETSRKTVN